MDEIMELSKRIRWWRKKRCLTQEDVAAKLGVTRTAISAWEVGIADPTQGNLRRFVKIIGVGMGEFYDATGKS
jgi:transcriptional regulator with XRE-family HTH domain